MNGYEITIKGSHHVGYAPKIDQIFVCWFDDDIVHCLGAKGAYQICFIDEVDEESFVMLGEL